MRATYHRYHGTEHFLGFYDVHAGALGGVFRRRKHPRGGRGVYPAAPVLPATATVRDPRQSPQCPRSSALPRHLRRLRITPVFIPTDASWLNLIEAQFGVLRRRTFSAH
jgi:hypothetical protein